GKSEQPFADLPRVRPNAFDRDARRKLSANPQIALVQLRQEFLAEEREHEQGHDEPAARAQNRHDRAAQAPGQREVVGPAEYLQQWALARRRRAPEDEAREHRDDRQGDQQRADDGQRDRQRHRPEELALDALGREDRDVDRPDDQHGKRQRPPDLHRGGVDLWNDLGPGRPALAQPPQDVLGHDDGAIDDDPEVDRAERQEIRRHASKIHEYEGKQERQRNRERHEQRGPDVVEEERQEN